MQDSRKLLAPPAFLDITLATLFPWNFGGPTHTHTEEPPGPRELPEDGACVNPSHMSVPGESNVPPSAGGNVAGELDGASRAAQAPSDSQFGGELCSSGAVALQEQVEGHVNGLAVVGGTEPVSEATLIDGEDA